MRHTVESIRSLLARNDEAVGRALMALNARQTADEQVAESTKHHNNRGFRPCHAKMGTSMAKQFARKGKLSEKQLAYWRKPMKTGVPRIAIYAAQLLKVAAEKAAKEAA